MDKIQSIVKLPQIWTFEEKIPQLYTHALSTKHWQAKELLLAIVQHSKHTHIITQWKSHTPGSWSGVCLRPTSNGFVDLDGSEKLGMGCNRGRTFMREILIFCTSYKLKASIWLTLYEGNVLFNINKKVLSLWLLIISCLEHKN